jgi:hypothetical protein
VSDLPGQAVLSGFSGFPTDGQPNPGELLGLRFIPHDEVAGRRGQQEGILVELPEAVVAVATEKTTDLACLVVVVDVQHLSFGWRLLADQTHALLPA